jgi:uncharacterized protein (UPF0335 family)
MSNVVVKISDAALAANVDKLGALNAELAILNKKAKDIKAKLVASGYDEISGKLFKAVIVKKDGSVLFDAKIAKSLLSDAAIAKCEKLGAPSISVSLYDL